MAILVSAPLPDLDLDSNATLTVDTQDAAAIVTQLVVHLRQDIPDDLLADVTLPPAFAYVPTE